MFSSKLEVTFEDDFPLLKWNYFGVSGTHMIISGFILSGFNLEFLLCMDIDHLIHETIIWYFKYKFFTFGHSLTEWIHKFLLIPMYCFVLESNTMLPTSFIIFICLMNVHPKNYPRPSEPWKSVLPVFAFSEAGLSIYMFSGYSPEQILSVIMLSLFFAGYIWTIWDSVSKLVFKLRKENEHYKNLLHLLNVVVITTDINLDIIHADKKFMTWTKENLIGKNLADFPFYNKKKLDILMKTKKHQTYDFKALKSNGELFCCVVEATIQHSRIKNAFEIFLFIHDVSKVKKNEEQEKIFIQNTSSLKAKNDLVASISHEIRNPLQVILYNTEILLTKNLTQEVEDIINQIDNSAKLLCLIVGDILDYSKISQGTMIISESPINIQDIVQTSIQMNNKALLEKKLNLYVDFDFSLPRIFMGDSTRILQIMNNFISNAIKFTDEGKINVQIKNSTNEKGEEMLYFECRDTGIGISEQNMGQIFHPFFQFSHQIVPPNRFKGWGLGLSICQKLLNLMKGTIGVESKIGKGTKIWFIVPLKKCDDISTFADEWNKKSMIFKQTSILHSDEYIVNQIIGILKNIPLEQIEVNSITLKDPLIFLEKKLFNKVSKQHPKGKYQNISNPIIPWILLRSFFEGKEIENEIVIRSDLNILIVDDNALVVVGLCSFTKSKFWNWTNIKIPV